MTTITMTFCQFLFGAIALFVIGGLGGLFLGGLCGVSKLADMEAAFAQEQSDRLRAEWELEQERRGAVRSMLAEDPGAPVAEVGRT